MPDESKTPVGTTQTSQNNQSATSNSGNDFVLDFGNLGDTTPVTEEIEVDSLSQEEKTDDELGFDIDLGSNDQNIVENTEGQAESTDVDKSEIDVSTETSEGGESLDNFDFSMDYEGTNEEEKSLDEEDTVSDNEEIVADEEDAVSDNEEIVADEEDTVSDNEEIVADKEDAVSDNEEIVADEEDAVSDNEEIVADEEDTVSDNEEIVADEEDLPKETSEEGSLDSIKYEDDGSENIEIADQPNEGHLFHQINEDDQNEFSFDVGDSNSNNGNLESSETTTDTPLFMGANEDISEKQDGEINFDLPEVSDNSGGLTDSDMGIPEQRQPELSDLLSNSPIDLSKELGEVPENSEVDLLNEEIPVDSNEAGDQEILEDSVSEPAFEEIIPESTLEESTSDMTSEVMPVSDSEEVVSEAIQQEVEPESVVSAENNESLLDVPQVESNTQNIQQDLQQEIIENNEVTQIENQPQLDETITTVNNMASQMNEQNVDISGINVSEPVELSNVVSSETETATAETEGRVQSTLSLDQILDSELLSNPHYADNSKASPQNLPASGGKGKIGLLIGAGVAVLACCVVVLAFPSITSTRKSVDTTSTGTIIEYSISDDSHPSAPNEPTGLENPVDDPQTSEIPDLSENPNNPLGQGSAQGVSFPDDGNDLGDGGTSTEPIPYVWTDEGETDEPEIQEPVIEEIDAGQILNVISSFKSQAETYYSHGEQHADKQLMKYAQKLVTLCDNYSDKVNNGEGTDSESLSSFKSTANKIINKIDTYLGGDEEVQVIREATIDGESYFEGKDELKEYLYNNR